MKIKTKQQLKKILTPMQLRFIKTIISRIKKISPVSMQIQFNRNSGLKEENLIKEEKSIEKKLKLIYFLARHYTFHVSGIFSSSFIEKTLVRVSNQKIDNPKLKKQDARHCM